MTNKADLLKLADLSSKGKISLNQAEGYLAEKGMKKSERDKALRYIDAVKKEQHSKKQKSNNSKMGMYILILIILGMVALYLLYYNKMDYSSFVKFK